MCDNEANIGTMSLARNLERVIKGTSILTNKLTLSVKNNVSISKLSLKSSYDYRSFSRLNFLRSAILGFMTSCGCRNCQEADVLLCRIIGQPYDVMESKLVSRRKFKSETTR